MTIATHIAAATFAYPEVDTDIRARLAAASQRIEPDGATFLLNTCLRTEVVVAGDVARLHARLNDLFGGSPDVGSAKIRQGAAAVEHLFRVVSGLESPIRGEQEILTQYRRTLNNATERGAVTGIFAKLLETAVAVSRQVRDILPDSPHDSMGAVAAQVVGFVDRVAVLGSGAMAMSVVRALQGLPAPPAITVIARSPERVTVGGVDVWPFTQARTALEEFPAVISATSAKQRLVESASMSEIMAGRRVPLTLVDMAMPPDFTVEPSPRLRYLDIDDLARMAERKPRDDEADGVVHAAAVGAHHSFADHHQVGPVIGGLTRQADEIVEDVVSRFGGRLANDQDLSVLRQTAHTVARTLLAAPIAYVKQADRAPEAVDIVADAFGVDG
jgi:glutamyl-tRNA reductase